METVGKRIKQKRKEKGLRQDELGDLIGKSRQMISYYETGSTEPGLAELEQMAKIFNCSIAYLIGEVATLEVSNNQQTLPISERAKYERRINDLLITVRILSEQLGKLKVCLYNSIRESYIFLYSLN